VIRPQPILIQRRSTGVWFDPHTPEASERFNSQEERTLAVPLILIVFAPGLTRFEREGATRC
jgi:hypothetical protein